MSPVPSSPQRIQLIVFADDWGRHPSSSQMLVRELLPKYPVLWVNTTGTRRPRLGMADAKRAISKLAETCSSHASPFTRIARKAYQQTPENLTVIAPTMYPGFRKPWQRRLNASRIADAVNRCGKPGYQRVVITTLPITADLPGRIDADCWLYYCVDDYAQWPGVDLEVMQAMERELMPKMHGFAAVSEVLRDHQLSLRPAASPTLIDHGVNVELWDVRERGRWNAELNHNDPLDDAWHLYEPPDWAEAWADERVALFWGLIDGRMDARWIEALRRRGGVERIALVGPTNAPPSELYDLAELPGKAEHLQLPALAAKASVLIMPYVDAPVTRAMQPLKLKEYLATMRPVVVRDLPSTRRWSDCCDVVGDAQTFAKVVAERSLGGLPESQAEARRSRLFDESWAAKAQALESLVLSTISGTPCTDQADTR